MLKTKCDTDKSELENKIPDTNGLVKKTNYDTKITKIEGKIPGVNNLVAKIALTAVENKIPDVSSLVKKTDYDAVTEIENKLNNHNHDNKVAKANFDNTISDLDSETEVNKTKTDSTENKLNKLKTFDSSYFIGKSHFEEDGTQNYSVFQSLFRYFKVISNTEYVSLWQSKGLSNETIGLPPTSDNNLISN